MQEKAEERQKTKLSLGSHLLQALEKYEQLCKENAAGSKGIARKKHFQQLIVGQGTMDVPLPDLRAVYKFYKQEEQSGWFVEPRLVTCLRDAFYKIFQIPSPPFVCVWTPGMFAGNPGISLIAREERRREWLDTAISRHLQESELRDRGTHSSKTF